jgi:hypothetical protein
MAFLTVEELSLHQIPQRFENAETFSQECDKGFCSSINIQLSISVKSRVNADRGC